MRTITNNYRDAQILNLGSGGERGPYLVTQTGVAPSDPFGKERMFVLRPDGRWVDFNAYACQGKPEAIGRDCLLHHNPNNGDVWQIVWPGHRFSTCPSMKRDSKLG